MKALHFTLLCLMPFCGGELMGQAGVLDPTFGNQGKVTSSFGLQEYGRSMALQPDGKIILGGATAESFIVARYNTDGSLDSAFGSQGRAVHDFVGGIGGAKAVALQSDGKIILAGTVHLDYSDFFLVRYHADGTLDESFGTDGIATAPFLPMTEDEALTMVVQPDDKVVMAGSTHDGSNGVCAIARFTADGFPDPAFGNGGMVINDIGGIGSEIRGLALDDNGRILGCGFTIVGSGVSDYLLLRYNADGTLDPSFGTGGVVTTDFGLGLDQANTIAIQPDGRIVCAGASVDNGVLYDRTIARYDANGTLDPSFGNAGLVVSNLVGQQDDARALVLQPDGKLVIGGDRGDFGFTVSRYHPDGSVDSSFAEIGYVHTWFGSFDAVWGLAIQPDLRIIAAGYGADLGNQNAHFAMARYLNDELHTGVQPETSIGGLVVYPDPTDAMATIVYRTEKAETVSLRLLDMTGRVARIILANAARVPGEHSEAVDLTGLASGSYVLEMRTREGGWDHRIHKR